MLTPLANALRVQQGAVVDEARVTAFIRETRQELEEGPMAWLVPRFFKMAGIATVAVVLLPVISSGELGRILDPSAAGFWVRWLGPSVLTIPLLFREYRRNRRRVEGGVEGFVREVQKEWMDMTGEGWLRQVGKIGAQLTAWVGGSVGLLLAIIIPFSDVTLLTRISMFFGFIGATALWTFPMAFVIRWISIRGYRKFLRFCPEPVEPQHRLSGP